jgi:hypothetical protein
MVATVYGVYVTDVVPYVTFVPGVWCWVTRSCRAQTSKRANKAEHSRLCVENGVWAEIKVQKPTALLHTACSCHELDLQLDQLAQTPIREWPLNFLWLENTTLL